MKPLEKTPRSEHLADLRDFQDQFASVSIDEAYPLLEELATHPSPMFRGCALRVLEKFAPERVEAMALQFLDDPHGGLRFSALYILAGRGYGALMPLAARLLASDIDECVRSFAAFCLGMIGDASVIPVLRTAVEYDTGTDHEETPIRETAQRAIRIIEDRLAGKGSPDYIPSLNWIRVSADSGKPGG